MNSTENIILSTIKFHFPVVRVHKTLKIGMHVVVSNEEGKNEKTEHFPPLTVYKENFITSRLLQISKQLCGIVSEMINGSD